VRPCVHFSRVLLFFHLTSVACSTQSTHSFECTAEFAQSEARIVDVDLMPGTRKAQHGMPRGFISTRFVNPCGIIGPAHFEFIEFIYCRLEHATFLRFDIFHGAVRLCKYVILISRPWMAVFSWHGESKPTYEFGHGMCEHIHFSASLGQEGHCFAAAKSVNGTCFCEARVLLLWATAVGSCPLQQLGVHWCVYLASPRCYHLAAEHMHM